MGLSIAVARTSSASGFGAFAIAFLLFGICLAVTKSAVGQPLQMRLSGASAADRHRGFQAGLGAATVLGAGFAVLASIAGLAVGGELGGALVALALVLPGLVLQDSYRMAAFTLGRPQVAALIDAVWAAVQFGMLALLISNGQNQVGGLIVAWGAAAAISAVVGAAVLRVRPAPSRTADWVRQHRDLIRYLLPEYFLGLGTMQLGILLVGLIAGLAAVGSLRAAQVLLGPLGVVGAAIFQFAIPEVARRSSVSNRWLIAFAGAVSAALGLLTIVYVVLMLLLPDRAGVALFGSSWPGAAVVLLAMGLGSVSSALANGPAGVLYGSGPGPGDVQDQPRQGTGAAACSADQHLGCRCRGGRVGPGRGRGRSPASVDSDLATYAASPRQPPVGHGRLSLGRGDAAMTRGGSVHAQLASARTERSSSFNPPDGE